MGQFLGALLRAVLVGLMVSAPALLLSSARSDSEQIVVLFAIFAGILVLVEYAARYPGLVEFRYAPPYNRLRFGALFAMLVLLSYLFRGENHPGTFSHFVVALGALVGGIADFPYSPVRLLLLTLPADTPVAQVAMLRAALGIGVLVMLATLVAFLLSIWRSAWPLRHRAFNVWINLPTFDPTAGGDVVERLERDARINAILGILLPFLVPAGLLLAGSLINPLSEAGTQTQIWIVAIWAFLPLCLLMRGMALARLARIIRNQRRRDTAGDGVGLQPV